MKFDHRNLTVTPRQPCNSKIGEAEVIEYATFISQQGDRWNLPPAYFFPLYARLVSWEGNNILF